MRIELKTTIETSKLDSDSLTYLLKLISKAEVTTSEYTSLKQDGPASEVIVVDKRRGPRGKYNKKPKLFNTEGKYHARWSETEDTYLRRNYLTMRTKKMSKVLGRTNAAVKVRLHTLKLVRHNRKHDGVSETDTSPTFKTSKLARLAFIHSRADYLMQKYQYSYDKALEVAISECDGKAFIKKHPQPKALPVMKGLSEDEVKMLFEALKDMIIRKGHIDVKSLTAMLSLDALTVIEEVLLKADEWASVLNVKSKDLKFDTKNLVISYKNV